MITCGKNEHSYQGIPKVYLRIYKDFYHDMTYWSFFSSVDEHYRKEVLRPVSSLLGVYCSWQKLIFLPVTIDCASNEEIKKEEGVKIEGESPLGQDGYEIPFGIGKFNLSCENVGISVWRSVGLNVDTSLKQVKPAGRSDLVFLFLIGSSHESQNQFPN
jgi:hypothetical protein